MGQVDIMALHAKAFTVATLLPAAELRAMRGAVEDALCLGLTADEFAEAWQRSFPDGFELPDLRATPPSQE